MIIQFSKNLMKKIFKLVIVTIILFFHNSSAGASLWWTEQMVSLRFDVNHISHQQLQVLLPAIDAHDVLLFDVRRPEEYQMSRITGSIQIAPDMSVQEFITQYGNAIHNKSLIFYCSVGYRSSEFIQRIEKQVRQKGVTAMYNLKGGIFRWYNENHPVINNNGETDKIHPSDDSWANLINKR